MQHYSKVEHLPLIEDDDGVFTLSFLLLPEYAMVSLLSAIEPLRIVNRLAEKEIFRWQCLSENNNAVIASNGMAIQPCLNMHEVPRPKNIFVNASFHPEKYLDGSTCKWLKDLQNQGAVYGALDTGCYLLAHARLLDNRRVTLHWEAKPAFKERHPYIRVSDELFEIDGKCITGAGGNASGDLFLYLIKEYCGLDMAKKVCDQLIKSGLRGQSENQKMGWMKKTNIHHPKLLKALDLMAENIESPLSTQAIAEHLAISIRQIERVFMQYLHCSPTKYYIQLRIDHARYLLLDSSLSIAEVALASGFSSTSHFCRRYKEIYGTTASHYRSLKQ